MSKNNMNKSQNDAQNAQDSMNDFWLDLGPASAYAGTDAQETARANGDLSPDGKRYFNWEGEEYCDTSADENTNADKEDIVNQLNRPFLPIMPSDGTSPTIAANWVPFADMGPEQQNTEERE